MRARRVGERERGRDVGAEEDRYVPLVQELELIRTGGFSRPDCFWRDGGLAVYGGFKDASIPGS